MRGVRTRQLAHDRRSVIQTYVAASDGAAVGHGRNANSSEIESTIEVLIMFLNEIQPSELSLVCITGSNE